MFRPDLFRLPRFCVAMVLTVALAACSATFTNHGYVPPEEDLQSVLVGVDTRGTVEETIGRPAASGVLRDEAWIYNAYRVRTFAYQAPEVVERDLVAISFDADGVVSNIERFGLEDGRAVQLSRRVTESTISELGFFRQILSNFGRFDLGSLGI